MSTGTLTLIAAFVIVFMLMLWRDRGRLVARSEQERQAACEAADRIVESLEKNYQADHAMQRVDVRQFPRRDILFYNARQAELERLGFRLAGDVEDATLSQANPAMRTFVRCMVNVEGHTTAGIYDATPRGLALVMAWLGGMRRFKVVDLESELSDGAFVVTTTADAFRMSAPPQITRQHAPRGVSPEQLLAAHRTAVEEQVRARGARTVSIRTLEELLASQARQQNVLHEFRKAQGYGLTDEEKQHFGRGRGAAAAAVLKEVDNKTLFR